MSVSKIFSFEIITFLEIDRICLFKKPKTTYFKSRQIRQTHKK